MGEPHSASRYQVMEPLGHGGQGSTFRGVDRDTGDSVAIKALSLKGAKSWKAFDRFEREMDTLAKLTHPGIPKYLGRYAYEASGDYFLVMELIDGVPLSKHMHDPGLTPRELRSVLDQILEVLAYLHEQRPALIHRDIKPANVILRPDGTISLVDFGGVRQRGGGETEATTTVGTFGYMAPEQLHGTATTASDIYALGATILTLLARKSPEALPHRGLRFDFDAVEIPQPLARVLPAMLEPDPELRLANVAAVRAALVAKPKTPPRAEPKAAAAPKASVPSNALVRLPQEALALAKTPAPFSVIVWVLAALSSGVLLVFEAVFLPFFFQLATALRNKPPSDPRAVAFRVDYERFKTRVGEIRNAATHIADGTRPST